MDISGFLVAYLTCKLTNGILYGHGMTQTRLFWDDSGFQLIALTDICSKANPFLVGWTCDRTQLS